MPELKQPYTRADYAKDEHTYHPGRRLGPWETIIDTRRLEATEAAELRARVEKLEGALKEIRVGKKACDNQHPLGEYASQAIRFTCIAKTALEKKI
jgi:hypothetical protein